MNQKRLTVFCAGVFAAVLIIGVAMYFIGGEQFYYSPEKIYGNEQAQAVVGEVYSGVVVEQHMIIEDAIHQLYLFIDTGDKLSEGNLFVELLDDTTEGILYSWVVPHEKIENGKFMVFRPQGIIEPQEKHQIVLRVSSDATANNAITLWKGADTLAATALYHNGEKISGTLCFKMGLARVLWLGPHYWYAFLTVLIALSVLIGYLLYANKRGQYTFLVGLLNIFVKYKFLLIQLIKRDFKTKYKRSMLGIAWSFLNPILTMTIQYMVFSTIFRTDISNFPVYLLIGIIMFGFFSESCGMGISAITANTALITKVYVPKYIYPIARVISSLINLLLSLVPLVALMIITRTPMSTSLLVVPFGIICLIIFCMGLTFLLSSMMVFFRDVQFLWGIVSLLWMYATPIFYPESIIPAKFALTLKLNPLYHIIRFIRTAILEGVSPEPKAYLICAGFSIGMLSLGALVFKKTQSKFVLYL